MGIAAKTVLVVEDEPLILLEMVETLEQAGYEVLGATTVPQALDRLETETIDAATLDINLRGRSAATVASKLVSLAIPYVICSAYPPHMVGPWAGGAQRVEKPIEPRELIGMVTTILSHAGED